MPRSGPRGRGSGPRRPRHHRSGRGGQGVVPLRARCGRQLRRVHRCGRRRGRRGGRDAGQRRGCGPARGRRRRHRRQGAPSLERLRLRRHAAGAVCRVRHALPAVGLRPHQAGGGDLGRRRQPAPLHRPLLVAVRPRGEELRRDDAAAGRRAAGGARGLRSGRLPYLHATPRRGLRAADRGGRVRDPSHRGRRTVLVVRLRPGDLRPGRSRVPGDGRNDRDACPQGPAPAYSVLGSERPDPLVLPHWSRGLAAYLADRVEAAA